MQARCLVLQQTNKIAWGEAGFNLLYATYRCGAEHRDIEFSISKEDFKIVTGGLCTYCGSQPYQKIGRESSGYYVYNGVDRQDNLKGYTKENCVPSCGECNLMKGKKTVEGFIAACRAVVNHFQ